MPRRSLAHVGPHVWHAMNRAVQHVTLFSSPSDYDAFLSLLCRRSAGQSDRVICLLRDAKSLASARTCSQWPLLSSSYLQWLAGVHGSQWRKSSQTTGRGAVYQGRFRAVPVEADQSFVRVSRYIECNPIRAGLVTRAEEWHWSSAARVERGSRPELAEWPTPRPRWWTELLNSPQEAAAVDLIRSSIVRGVPYGSREWQEARFGDHISVARSTAWRARTQSRAD